MEKKTSIEDVRARKKGFHCLPCHPEVPRRDCYLENTTRRRIPEDEKRNEQNIYS